MKTLIAIILAVAFVGCTTMTQTPAPAPVAEVWEKSAGVQPVAVTVKGQDGKEAVKIQYLPLEYNAKTRQFRVYIEPEKPADVKKIEPKVEPKPVAPKQ